MSSIRNRFIFSAAANAGRAAVSLAVGLLVARGLGPVDYGNLAYLLGSFWAIRALLDLGSSSAFYTFIGQRGRSYYYYTVYFAWLCFQFLFTVGLVAIWLPAAFITEFWLGLDRELILLAFLATFLQNQVWLTMVQLHESKRKTKLIQIAGLLIVLAHLILVFALLIGGWLSVRAVLWAIVGEYLIATAWLTMILRRNYVITKASLTENDLLGNDLKMVLMSYLRYCRPMAVIAGFAFCYEIADRWLLQRYGGASQQGFYQVASQLSTVSLLAATSILNIFWKEIAEANERGDDERVAGLYQKTTQTLIFIAAFISCFLAPWSETLVDLLLGNSYAEAWPVLMLMLFYPIHQVVGQVNGTLFMATARNSVYMKITVTGLLMSIPVSYVLLSQGSGWGQVGLGLGATGLALKVVGLNFIFVNIQSWMISRHYGFPFKWHDQLGVVAVLFLIGYACKFSVDHLLVLIQSLFEPSAHLPRLIGPIVAGALYFVSIIALLVRMPRLAGMNCDEVNFYLAKAGNFWRQVKGCLI